MNSIKGALCASLFFISSALANQPLVGVSWKTPSELTAIAALSEQVRYVARGIAFVEASESAVKEFTKQEFDILCLDRPRAGDRYFVADHLHFPLPQDRPQFAGKPARSSRAAPPRLVRPLL